MIKFFKKNVLDLTNTLPTFAISDTVATDTGSAYTTLMRNRNNNSGWATTGSADAGSTTMIVSFGETRTFQDLLFIGQNWKNFNVKYWDGTASYVDFSTVVNETASTVSTAYYHFNEVSTTAFQIKINGTQTANQDKYLKQLVCTTILGTFTVQPQVMPSMNKNRKTTQYLSGKSFVSKGTGAFNCRIKMPVVSNDADLTLIETLYDSYEGFLVWLCGGDVSQFETIRQGFRLQDVFYCDLTNDFSAPWNDGRWNAGMPIDLQLVEVS